jgi:hypothetical protein
MASEMAAHELKDHVVILDSIAECLAQADVVIITSPDPAYKALGPADFDNGRPVTVVDCWRILADSLADAPHVRYLGVGLGVDDEASAERLRQLWTLPAESGR